jgi:uroporphyrinogen decarboxylase
MFQELGLPNLRQVNDALNDKAKAKMLHICGNTTRLLGVIPETGADLYSFDYKVDLAAARDSLCGKIAFAGNIDPVSVIFEGTAEETAEAAKRCLAIAGETVGYVLMPGCDIPPKTKPENVKAMAVAVRRYRPEESVGE